MKKNEDMKMTPFDVSIQSKSMQMLKALVPFMAPKNQMFICTMIKFKELQNTVDYFNKHKIPSDFYGQSETLSAQEILTTLKEYCSEDEREQMESMLNMFQMMQMFEMFQNMEESAPESENNSPDEPLKTPFKEGSTNSFKEAFAKSSPPGNDDMFESMLTPEQKKKFEKYEADFLRDDYE